MRTSKEYTIKPVTVKMWTPDGMLTSTTVVVEKGEKIISKKCYEKITPHPTTPAKREIY